MNKILATLMLAALALSSCIKEDDSYKDLLPVQPGQYIYTYVTTQDRVAMQAANVGMRVAVLAAEVAKQRADGDQDVNVSNVTYYSQKILGRLFNAGAKIEEVEEGYKLTFDKNYQMPDYFYAAGSVLVRTNGSPELLDGVTWQVEMQPDFKLYSYSSYGGAESQVNMLGGTTTLTGNADGSYTIRISNIASSVEGNEWGASDWSSSAEGFTVRPDDENVTLAYSSCTGKAFKVEGSASGTSIYGNINGTAPLRMSYNVTDGLYIGAQIVSGTQVCKFTSPLDYDTSAYPAPDVRVVYSFDSSSRRYSYKIYYNGYVYPRE
ncbi:hypothetical protein [uncultured Alistipes sp.]|uniref:hypothetical protein n=1 Tax=uncultured Alistipes sp. TaxID=538949 RepID=UPI002805EB80|nr:hypothetical protein [uncultured Alistipes sp.]